MKGVLATPSVVEHLVKVALVWVEISATDILSLLSPVVPSMI